MKPDYIDFQDRSFPIAFLISFRCYGTWLHGDIRGSVNRKGNNIYGTPKRAASVNLEKLERDSLKNRPISLNPRMRKAAGDAIREVCSFRKYQLYALNVRTNHVHFVISANRKPEFIMTSMKSYCTRRFKKLGLISGQTKVWSRHGSTRYLWTDRHIEVAADYVLYGQGGELPDFD